MKPGKKDDMIAVSPSQLELVKTMITASAQITASMVTVANEKNPAKISEAFRVIYKTIQETVKGTTPKTTTGTSGTGDAK